FADGTIQTTAAKNQTLGITNDTLTLTDGGSVKLPPDLTPDPAFPVRLRFQGSEIYVHPTENATNVLGNGTDHLCEPDGFWFQR
ncbi:MAG: hypothetical protein AAF135_22565, partial [Bacteroidota bacterium]